MASSGRFAPSTHAQTASVEDSMPSEDDHAVAASAESGALLLPKELLVKVLEKVPQEPRLTSCVRVCRAWHEAGVAASTKVQLSCLPNSNTASRFNSLMSWLTKHGQHVTSLSLSRAGTPAAPLQLAQMPCSKLKELSLRRCHLQLTAAGNGDTAPDMYSLSRLVSLTRLDLGSGGAAQFAAASSNTFVEDYPDCFSALSQLTNLQHLQATAEAISVFDDREEFPNGVLSCLVHLTHLELNLFAVTAPALEGLTRLSNLQVLNCGSMSDAEEAVGEPLVTTDALAAISGLHNLTSLAIPGAECVLGSSSTPGFSTLTALRRLELHCGAGLDPSVLAHFTGLQELRCWDMLVMNVSMQPASQRSDTEALLGVLPRLQQLQKLELYTALPDTAPPAQYSALVASSKLQDLLLTGSELPQAAWPAMFGGQRQLSSLTSLTFNGWIKNSGGNNRLHTPDLRGLAQSCPSLRHLCVHGSVDAAADYAVLQPLQHLALYTSNLNDDSIAGLACLTSLKSLVCMEPNSLTDEALAPLTALTQLTGLQILRGSSAGQGDGLHFMRAGFLKDSPSDVWRQLQEYLQQTPAARAGYVSQGVQEFHEFWAAAHDNLY